MGIKIAERKKTQSIDDRSSMSGNGKAKDKNHEN